MADVRLGPPTHALSSRMVERGWLDDLPANRARGLPGGKEGRLEARVEFLTSKDSGLVGVYADLEPVGMLTTESGELGSRTIRIWLYVDEAHRGTGVARVALDQFLAYAFETPDVYRVESRLLQVKGGLKRASEFLKKAGFSHEALLKSAVWVDGKPMNVHVFRLLRPDWVKLREEAA